VHPLHTDRPAASGPKYWFDGTYDGKNDEPFNRQTAEISPLLHHVDAAVSIADANSTDGYSSFLFSDRQYYKVVMSRQSLKVGGVCVSDDGTGLTRHVCRWNRATHDRSLQTGSAVDSGPVVVVLALHRSVEEPLTEALVGGRQRLYIRSFINAAWIVTLTGRHCTL
jgi:hypothetical protein